MLTLTRHLRPHPGLRRGISSCRLTFVARLGRRVAVLFLGLGLAAHSARAAEPSAAGAPPKAAPARVPAWDPGRMYLKLRALPPGGLAKASPRLVAILGSALGGARPLAVAGPGETLAAGLERLFEVRLPAASDVPWLAAKLSRLPEVEYAEPVFIYEIVGEPAGEAPLAPRATPNDPKYLDGTQAYLDRLQVTQAWEVMKSENGSPRPVVCVVDGGTNWEHEDLLANMWTNPGETPGNGIDDDHNGYVDDIHGWNFRDNNGNPRGSTATPTNADHGTHTGGLLAGVTDNGKGIASAGWNPFLMAVNASGTADRNIAYGAEGIVYAARNGAKVISCSWGGAGSSRAMQDIVDFATAQGALLVAAAGNGNTSTPFYPAAYGGAIAVANVQSNDGRYAGGSGSNYGGWVDVAAPGTLIYSLFDFGTTNAYGFATGTSMACPVAAAVAALIKAQHPTWNALEVGEQLRVTADNINAVNPGFEDLLGKGRVNARRAVTESPPAVRVTGWSFVEPGGNGELNQGDTATMTVTLHNYLTAALAPTFTLSSSSPYINITDATQTSPDIAEDATVTLPGAFAFTVSPNVPPGAQLDLRIDMAAGGYADFQFIPVTLEPNFKTHDINPLHVSLTGSGNVGFIGFPAGQGDNGLGFTWRGGSNVLFEGALLLGTGPTKLSDSARYIDQHFDFAPALHSPPRKLTPGVRCDQSIRAAFTDSINVSTPLGVRVDLTSYAQASPPNVGFVILAYTITNTSTAAFDSLWAGLWFDWDIDENHYDTNRTAYDATRRLGYAWDETPGLPYVGVEALSGAVAGYSAIANDGTGMPWDIYNGFTKVEKWDVLQRGTGILSAGPTDISNALSTGPYRVAADTTITVYFALLAGDNLSALQANADKAVQFFANSVTADTSSNPPSARLPLVTLGPATPNPFNPSTTFELVVRERRQDVTVAVYDARGRHVTTLATGPRQPGRYPVVWDGRDARGNRAASGLYYARLRSGGVGQVRRAVLTN